MADAIHGLRLFRKLIGTARKFEDANVRYKGGCNRPLSCQARAGKLDSLGNNPLLARLALVLIRLHANPGLR